MAMAIYTRLKDLREDADKTQSDVARYLGTTAQYYGKYEKGERELPFDRAIRLAEYYNVTLDYLAGRSNNKLGQPLTDDEASLLKKWHSLSERTKARSNTTLKNSTTKITTNNTESPHHRRWGDFLTMRKVQIQGKAPADSAGA
jgi:transcriptional regulator with XRE-family HTH domain